MKIVMLLALFAGLSAEARITNFRTVELKSFTCGAAHHGSKRFLGAEWTAEDNKLVIYQKDTEDGEVGYAADYEVYKEFPMSQTYMLLADAVGDFEGHVQFMLRDGRPSTISINSRGVSYADCVIETK